MTKEDTIIIKGVAILFMVWVHCFNVSIAHVLDFNDIVIGGEKLCYLLTRLTRPVELYVILSGYGLYFTYISKKSIDLKRRLKKLYGLYIFTLLIFIPIAFLLGIKGYPGSTIDIVSNVIGWETTYNSTIWFLFPYAVIVVVACPLFRMLDSNPILSIIGSIGLYIGAYLVSWMSHHGYIHIGYTIKELVRVLNMILPFIVGAAMCKYNVVSISKSIFEKKQHILYITLVALCVVRLSTDFDFMLQLVYSTLIIALLSSARKPDNLSKILFLLGKYSTTMWFVHAYFIWYLFDEYPYTLKYPILIFGVSLIESFLAAIAIDWCYRKVIQLLHKFACKVRLKS